jgi:hypothetical protein
VPRPPLGGRGFCFALRCGLFLMSRGMLGSAYPFSMQIDFDPAVLENLIREHGCYFI